MRVLLIGSGGRENAIAWSVYASPLLEKLYCIPGNPGIKEFAVCIDCLLYTSPSPRDNR